jgi:Family of unknown function (DUF7033)
VLRVRHPATYEAERKYLLEVVLGEFLGLAWDAEVHSGDTTELFLADREEGPRLTLREGLFASAEEDWLRPRSLPALPLRRWDPAADGLAATLVEPRVPVLFGSELSHEAFAELGDEGITVGADLLGGIFFQLTRYEELARPVRDQHERFPASASVAYREGFLDRPLVNEYLEVLRGAIERLWPRLRPRRARFRERLSHDVDWPTHEHSHEARLSKAIAGDVLRRRDPGLAIARLKALRSRIEGRLADDPYYSFDFIMDLSEAHGLQSSFYFMAGCTDPRFDATYTLEDPRIGALIRRIHERGHEIGLHPSYGTFRDPALIRRERDALLEACERLGVGQQHWGGRQHYLRWENPITWRAWEEAELAYDSSLGYSSDPAFRCGTCYEYPAFDLLARRRLALRERPLIVMEQSAIDHGSTAPIETIDRMRERCRTFGGDFTLLWHNSRLATVRERRLYRASLRG